MTLPDESSFTAAEDAFLDEEEFDLACSSCNANLAGEELFSIYRVCPNCRRHYWIPARERIQLLADHGSFQETNAEIVSIDPLLFHDSLPVADRLAEAREKPFIAEAVITGTATIGGNGAIVVALDLAVFSAGIGIVAGEKIALAMEQAVTRRLPVIAICSGGSGKGQEGVLAFAQIGKLASAIARLRRVGVPSLAILTHPTTGNVLVGVANQMDFAIVEPGAQVGLSTGKEQLDGRIVGTESLLYSGAVDGVTERMDQREYVSSLLQHLAHRGSSKPSSPLPVVSTIGLLSTEEIQFARRSERPNAIEYLHKVAPGGIELRGDRIGGDDPGVLGRIARVDDVTVVMLGTVRGEWTGRAAAFTKINRTLRLAAHLELPVILLVETGATSSGSDEVSDSLAMAQTLGLLASLPVPVIAVAIGEVSGLDGMTLLSADRVIMLEHAVISQSSGDPVASARDCLRMGFADAILAEPQPADEDFEGASALLRNAIGAALLDIASYSPRRLADDRTRRFRHLGLTTAEGREAARSEWGEFQDVQKLIGRSFEEIRERWENRQLSMPSFTGKQTQGQTSQKVSFPSIALPKINLRKPDFSEFASRVATRRGQTTATEPDETPSGDSADDDR